MNFNQDAAYQVRGWRGVAFRFLGYTKKWEPDLALVWDEETDEEWEEDTGEGEWVEDTTSGRVIVVMVGDDKKYEVDASDLILLKDTNFCAGCGQIGCTANRG